MGKIDPKGWNRQDFVRFYAQTWHCPMVPVVEDKHPQILQNRIREQEPNGMDSYGCGC